MIYLLKHRSLDEYWKNTLNYGFRRVQVGSGEKHHSKTEDGEG